MRKEMMMKIRIQIVRMFIAVGLVMGFTCLSASAFEQAKQPAQWRTTPTLSQDVYPAYEFRSTSAYAPIVGQTDYIATTDCSPYTNNLPGRSIRRDIWDDEPDGDELGVIDTPVGEPYILLLFALLFLAYKKKSIRS